ncbi:MAG TPA: polyprenol monophosphomannose synthase, partial [Myxococcota bacterium]|nr:polyprenol monophosphomannose synthase [Myxococcota bacterium]
MQPPLEEAPRSPAFAFSIVVPTLDEAENVDELLRQIFALEGCPPFEVVVVDDDSKDGTAERARAWSASHPVRVIVRCGARGLAGAVILGAREASADVVVVMDADLSHPVSAIPALARAVLEGRADVAVGSRHTRGGAIRGWPLHRRIVSRIASSLAWPISAVSDPMSGFFAAPRAALLALGEAPAGFKILLELLSRGGSSLRAVEVPITFTDRVRGESKLGVTEVGQYLARLASFAGADAGSPALRRLLLALG